jgi:hypothetical protein
LRNEAKTRYESDFYIIGYKFAKVWNNESEAKHWRVFT